MNDKFFFTSPYTNIVSSKFNITENIILCTKVHHRLSFNYKTFQLEKKS